MKRERIWYALDCEVDEDGSVHGYTGPTMRQLTEARATSPPAPAGQREREELTPYEWRLLAEISRLQDALASARQQQRESACEVCGDVLEPQPLLCERCVNTDEADDLRHASARAHPAAEPDAVRSGEVARGEKGSGGDGDE